MPANVAIAPSPRSRPASAGFFSRALASVGFFISLLVVSVFAASGALGAAPITVDLGESYASSDIIRPHIVKGLVRDAEKQPLEGVAVCLSADGNSCLGVGGVD